LYSIRPILTFNINQDSKEKQSPNQPVMFASSMPFAPFYVAAASLPTLSVCLYPQVRVVKSNKQQCKPPRKDRHQMTKKEEANRKCISVGCCANEPCLSSPEPLKMLKEYEHKTKGP
jgi:hypothetical protein